MKELKLEGRLNLVLNQLFDNYPDSKYDFPYSDDVSKWRWVSPLIPANYNFHEARTIRLIHELIKNASRIEVLSSPSEYVRGYWRHINGKGEE